MNASLVYGDTSLLHRLMECNPTSCVKIVMEQNSDILAKHKLIPILVTHLVKLVDADSSPVRKDNCPSFKSVYCSPEDNIWLQWVKLYGNGFYNRMQEPRGVTYHFMGHSSS